MSTSLLKFRYFINNRFRCKTDNYVTFGYIPNLGYGKGKANGQTSTEKLQDQHNCIRLITDQIKKLRDEGYFWTTVMGRKVKVVLWIHILAGDCSGHNEVAGKFNCNGNTACPYRDCLCTKNHLSDPISSCKLVTIDDVEQARSTPNGLSKMSMHEIVNAFTDVPLSDLIHGIFGILPGKALHVLGQGIIKYMFRSITNLLGPGDSKKTEKDAYNALHHNLLNRANRQSEKDFPKMTIRGGFNDGTKMTAGEAVGNLFIQLCASYTETGIGLLDAGWKKYNITPKAFRGTIMLLLGFERWVNDSNLIDEVNDSVQLLAELISGIQMCFPRPDGNGWDIPKVHSMAKMLYYMKKIGKALNFSSQQGESSLKTIMKNHAQQTQRRPKVFAEQVARRRYETEVFQYAFEDIRPTLGLDYDRKPNQDKTGWVGEGRYTLTFESCDRYGKGPTKVDWEENAKNVMEIDVSETLKVRVRKYAMDKKYRGIFQVEGFTRFKMCPQNCDEKVHFHASEYIQGSPWYDFGMVQFEEDDKPCSETICPAQIMGFFHYITPGVPTPHLSDEKGFSNEDIDEDWKHDTNVYAVVHTASKYFSWSDIERDFVVPFELGDMKKCLSIINVHNIIDPLYVFEDMGGTGRNAGRYFLTLPRRKWSQYYRSKIKSE